MSVTSPIRIGTRKSKLALWQAKHVASLLQNKGIPSELVPVETKGDKILNVSIGKIGSKGVFTEEIEDMLQCGAIDIAVHSAKDLQSTLPDGFDILAFTKREHPHDVLASHQEASLKNENQLVVGTSSVRRIAILKRKYPQHTTIDIRGNLQTRIKKMEDGRCDVLLLAYAGIHRMEYDHLIREKLHLNEFTPAVGQGSMAIEYYKNLTEDKQSLLRDVLNDYTTSVCLEAERSFLRTIDGGCSIPSFALATIKSGQLSITGGLISEDGERMVKEHLTYQLSNPKDLGKQLGDLVLENGGDEILKQLKNNTHS
ncbi:MAG TPA: hydroxymethylbilane synthase [Cyclobacteriaceae bacterium]